MQHVYEAVIGCPAVDTVVIATDCDEVLQACRSFGARADLTSPDHLSGTDRVAEVAQGLDHEIVVNVQGDEPLIQHADLERLIGLFHGQEGSGDGPAAPDAVMTTLAVERTDTEGFADPNIVKVVLALDDLVLDGPHGEGRALYFSRAPVPHWRRDGSLDAEEPVRWYQHVGIYAYRRDFLLKLATLRPTPLEKRERLEQLRVLEHGYGIRVGLTSSRHLGIDTEEEYRKFVAEYYQPT